MQLCFPHLHVILRGGAEKVIESTKALRANPALHTFSAHGIVDRDVRDEIEVTALETQGIHVLRFAEAENVLCSQRLVAAVAAQLSLDATTVVADVTRYVLDALNSELEAQVVGRSARRIRYHLSCYSPTASSVAGVQQGLNNLLSTLDVPLILAEARTAFTAAMNSGQLDEILTVYNRKSIDDRISICFGLKNGEYPEMVLRLLKGADSKTFADHLKAYLPKV
jgi:hypothetical protein